jgi:hypothetical protein
VESQTVARVGYSTVKGTFSRSDRSSVEG